MLSYTSPLEALAEKFHSSPMLLEKLNPGQRLAAGESITVPNVITEEPNSPPAQRPDVTVIVTKETGSLTVKSADGRVLLHAPVTVGSEHDALPIGTWKVTGVQLNPTFSYNPALFWDAEPSHSKAKIPPGPNNPVGVVWIDINKEHYGLHGTPRPSRIGYTESHGCVRLTNWDAMRVAKLVKSWYGDEEAALLYACALPVRVRFFRAGTFHGGYQFVQLEMQRQRFFVLRALNQEHHQKRDDRAGAKVPRKRGGKSGGRKRSRASRS